MLGFGAKLAGQVCHCFNLCSEGEANGVTGMLDVYRSALSSVQLSGPTVLSPVDRKKNL